MSPDEAAVLGILTIAVVVVAIVHFWAGVAALVCLLVFASFSHRFFNR
jgi:hypothetical protein